MTTLAAALCWAIRVVEARRCPAFIQVFEKAMTSESLRVEAGLSETTDKIHVRLRSPFLEVVWLLDPVSA